MAADEIEILAGRIGMNAIGFDRLTKAPPVPTRWWRGSGRWSLNTLWHGYRAALWGEHQFHPIDPESLLTKADLRWIQPALRHSAFAAARS